jgi:hypothetical protein
LLAAALVAGCLPYAFPAGHGDIGFARFASGDKGTAVHLAGGVHSAGLPGLVDKPMDFGIGYAADLYGGGKEGETSKVWAHGPYGEASRFVLQRDFYRISAGGRGQLLFGGGEIGWSALARGTAELYYPDANEAPGHAAQCGIHNARGAMGVGLYAESGYQRLPNGLQAWITTAGITFRWPFLYGIVILGCNL